MAAGLNAAALHIGGAAIATAIAWVQIHTATPSSGGSNEATSARQAVTLSDTGGVITASAAVNFTGGAASGPALFLGYWSASTAGTFYGYEALTGDQTFNAAGQYTVNSITITGSST